MISLEISDTQPLRPKRESRKKSASFVFIHPGLAGRV